MNIEYVRKDNAATNLVIEGNRLKDNGNYDMALLKYTSAMKCCDVELAKLILPKIVDILNKQKKYNDVVKYYNACKKRWGKDFFNAKHFLDIAVVYKEAGKIQLYEKYKSIAASCKNETVSTIKNANIKSNSNKKSKPNKESKKENLYSYMRWVYQSEPKKTHHPLPKIDSEWLHTPDPRKTVSYIKTASSPTQKHEKQDDWLNDPSVKRMGSYGATRNSIKEDILERPYIKKYKKSK